MMKNVKFLFLGFGIVSILLAVIARIFLPGKVLFGLASITYLRLTITMLLFTLTFHFLFADH